MENDDRNSRYYKAMSAIQIKSNGGTGENPDWLEVVGGRWDRCVMAWCKLSFTIRR